MADENIVGLYAKLYTDEFEKSKKVLDAQVASIEKNLDAFEKKRSDAAKQSADIEEKSNERIIKSLAMFNLAVGGAEKIVKSFTGTLEKAFAYGKAGAIINQTRESFQRLIGTEEQAIEMERRLSDAVRGTMTGTQLRATVIKLLTGAEGAFADRVKEEAPALFEMAAAANKLNPTLGGTSVILDSISQSLEMGTTRSLKRLGIIIDQTKAENEYARSIGKTSDELTEEEKKVAVLNATLEYHDTLLQQVGGNVDSDVDAFTRLDVAMGKSGSKIKSELAPALATAAEALALLLTWNDKISDALKKQETAVTRTAATYEEYIRQTLLAKAALTGVSVTDQSVAEVMARLNDTNDQSIKLTGMLSKAQWESARATQAATDAIADYTNKAASMLTVTAGMALVGKDLEEAQKGVAKALEERQKQIQDYSNKVNDLTIKSGENILEAEKDYHDKSADAWQSYMEKVADITADGIRKRANLARDYSDKISDAETDYQRSIEDAQYNHGQKLVDIERDYQKTIRNVQQTYQEDALDAIRNLDAIGLIRAKEKRDKDLANAETSRNEANTAESENYSRQLYEAQRAFEDKRREAELAYQRGLEDQRRAEQEATQEAKDAYNKQVADAAQGYADKQAAIDQAYRNENAAAANQYGYSEQAYRNHLVAMQNILAQYGIGNVTPTERTRVRRRAEGGLDLVSSPTHFLAGEAGPEIVYTAPLNRSVPAIAPQVIQHTGDFQHSIDSTIRSSVAGIDGRIVAAVSKVLREVLG